MLYTRYVFAFIYVIAALAAGAQSTRVNGLDSFSGTFITNLRATDGLQSHIVTDKSFYKSGEPLWFGVLLLHAFSQKVKYERTPLFVDLITEKDSTVTTLLLNAGQGQFSGAVNPPDSLKSGYYWLRAYTKKMATDSALNRRQCTADLFCKKLPHRSGIFSTRLHAA